MLTWDTIVLEQLTPPRVARLDAGGISIDFPLGAEGVEMFENGMARVREVFPDWTRATPFFEATRLGVYLPKGWDRDV